MGENDSNPVSTVRRRFLQSLGAGLGITAFAGETAAVTDRQTTGGTLEVAAPGDPQNLDPHTTTIDVAQLVLDNVVEELFELDENLEVKPLLAAGFERSDDGTTYEITLKDGVTFHNGETLTSADVKYTIERILDPDVGSPRAANFELVDTIATPDDTTVRFELSEPFAPFIIGLAESAGIIPEGSAEEQDPKQNPIGTGPFSLDEWQTDELVSLTRFDDYHEEELPYLDRVEFNVIPEAATRFTQLQSGPSHVMFGVPFQRADDINQNQNTTLQSVSGLWKQSFWFNTDEPPFDDPQVRRAVSHAINREQLVQGVLFGHGEVAHNPVPPTSSWQDAIEPGDQHTFDRERAQSLLDDAGVDPSSVQTSIKASRTPGPTYADTATLAQSMLSRLGMEVDVSIMDFSTWLQEVWVDKNFQLAVGSWAGRIDPDGWYYRQYHSEGAWNRWNYANDEVDQLLEEGRTTTDRSTRAEIYSQVDQLVSEDAPITYLYFREEMTGLKNTVGGYQLSAAHQAEFESTHLEE